MLDLTKIIEEIKSVPPGETYKDNAINNAIRLGMYSLAQDLDLFELSFSDSIAVNSGEPISYRLTHSSSGQQIDRITSAVFVGTSSKQDLNMVHISELNKNYRGYGGTGIPFQIAYHERKIWLYYIPSEAGTIYYTAQKIFTNFGDLEENYHPIIFWYTKRNLQKLDSVKWINCNKEVLRLIETFKGRLRPYKPTMPLSAHRRRRVQNLSERY